MLKTLRNAGLALLLSLFWATPALSTAEDLPAPETVLMDVFDQALDAFMNNQDAIREDPRVAYDLIDEILSPHVNFRLMSRLILGRNARDATPEQLDQFVSAFRENMIRTYSSMLSDNVDTIVQTVEDNGRDEIVEISPASRPDDRGRVNVRTMLHVQDDPIPVLYRLIASEEGWQVYDVVIENISFVTNYREEYGSEIRRGSLEQLISQLEERNRRAWQE